MRDLILRRRRQILVHSCIYYRFNTSLITDHKFDEWCYELVALQKKFPELAKELPYADVFRDFDGSTGYDLPYGEPEIVEIALRLLKTNRRR